MERVEQWLERRHLNVFGRPNVLYYDLGVDAPGPTGPTPGAPAEARLKPVAMPAFMVPSLGFTVRF